jgi:hypothetical protein
MPIKEGQQLTKSKEELRKEFLENFDEETHRSRLNEMDKKKDAEKVDKTLITNPSLDRYLWLLYRTIQKNNWGHLHEGFISEISYLRELADMMDYVNDEKNNVPFAHQVKQSMMGNQNVLYQFRQSFALDMFKKDMATKYDGELVIEMYNRTVEFGENKEEILHAVKDAFNRRKHEKNVNTLNQAFYLENTRGRPTKYVIPYNIERAVHMMIEEDMSLPVCVEELNIESKQTQPLQKAANQKKRPSEWTLKRYEKEMAEYKWTTLNNYLIERMQKGNTTLDDFERRRIRRNWNKIEMPEELLMYPTFMGLGFGKLGGKDGKKTVTAEVIKAKDLH